MVLQKNSHPEMCEEKEQCIWIEDIKALQGQDRLKNEILILIDKGVIKCHDK